MTLPVSYNVRNLVVRKTTTLMTALGVGLTVAVLLADLALVNGLRDAFAATGDPRNVLVLRKGGTSEANSGATREQFQDVNVKPGIARDDKGEPLASLELITVIANADPGDDGMYRARQTDAVIRRYLQAARKAKALLLLDIQPGRSDFFTEATRLEKWLKEPDVSLALDPEWRVRDGEVPGQIIGHVDAREVNATSAWLSQLVARDKLPEKLFVIHQFTDDMVPEAELKERAGLALVLNVDGFGDVPNKKSKYKAFTEQAPDAYHGFKLFYEEDTNLMRPAQVMRLRPRPVLVVYE